VFSPELVDFRSEIGDSAKLFLPEGTFHLSLFLGDLNLDLSPFSVKLLALLARQVLRICLAAQDESEKTQHRSNALQMSHKISPSRAARRRSERSPTAQDVRSLPKEHSPAAEDYPLRMLCILPLMRPAFQ
jgi:hypothetical protein